MRAYVAFLKIKYKRGVQYRAAALAGIATQFAWGLMSIAIFWAFYKDGRNAFPMTFSQLSTYLWLRQACLALFNPWKMENDIFNNIRQGNIAYELCRPINMYGMWFSQNVSSRLASVTLRALPILLIAGVVLETPFAMATPISVQSFLLFIISMLIGFLLMVASIMLVYISCFYTTSDIGIRMIYMGVMEFFTGAIVPLPFLPVQLEKLFNILPFASVSNVPFLIYSGYISSDQAIQSIMLQLIWLVVFIGVGSIWMKQSLKRVVVQGG